MEDMQLEMLLHTGSIIFDYFKSFKLNIILNVVKSKGVMILVFQSYMFKNFNVSNFEYLHENQKGTLYQMRYETTLFAEWSNIVSYVPPSFSNRKTP